MRSTVSGWGDKLLISLYHEDRSIGSLKVFLRAKENSNWAAWLLKAQVKIVRAGALPGRKGHYGGKNVCVMLYKHSLLEETSILHNYSRRLK